MAAYTVVNQFIDDAPKKRVLRGDKKRQPEAGGHIIEFPGGAVEVARLDDGTYWAHIIVNRAPALSELRGLGSAIGTVVDSRIDWAERRLQAIPSIPDTANLTQIAVRIAPKREG